MRVRPGIAGASLALLTALVYAHTFGVPFVYDDILAIPENPSIRSLGNLGDVLLPPGEGGLTVNGRPILNLSFALNYAISGTGVWSYHAANLLIHVGAGLALLGVARRILRRRPATAPAADALAVAIAGLWLLHPLQTQAVTYTVQRAESLMGCFYLLTLYAFVRGIDAADAPATAASTAVRPPVARRWFLLAAAACALGMATKEVMVTAPVMVLLLDRTFFARSWSELWQRRAAAHGALFATWGLLLALLASTGFNRGGTIGFGIDLPVLAYPATQFQALATYLARAFWPHPLVFEYGTFWVERAADLFPYTLLILPLLVLTLVALRRWPAAGFLGVWFFGIHAPTSLPQGTLQMIVEHRAYLSLAAVIALAVVVAHRLLGARVWLALALVGLGSATLTARRNHDYRSPLALWGDTVAKRPANPRAREGLAEALEAAGRFDEAVRHRQESVRLSPDEPAYLHNLALALEQAGREAEAIETYRRVVTRFPDEARSHHNLALLLAQRGDLANAALHHEAALRLRPREAQFRFNFGLALTRAGRHAEAAAQFQDVVALQPTHAEARFKLGNAWLDLDRVEDAVAQYEAALRQQPGEPEIHHNLGIAYARLERWADAQRAFETALRLRPDYADAQRSLEQLRRLRGL